MFGASEALRAVLDQALPVPFPLGGGDLNNPSWIPINDSLNHELAFLATDVRSTTHAGVSTLDFKQGYQPKGELDRFVMRQQGLERHYSIRVLQQMVSNMGDSRRVATTYLCSLIHI